jgi:hypothetical protein
MIPALWPSHKNCLFRKASLSLPLWRREKAGQYSSTIAPTESCRRNATSTWPPSTSMATMMNQEESMMMNYSRISPRTRARQMSLKMKMRSTEESGGLRTPSVPSIGETWKPTQGTHLTKETLMVPLLHLTIVSTTLRSGTSWKQPC